MIVKVISHKKGATKYYFDNGNVVSIIFGLMTYSDNHDIDLFGRTSLEDNLKKDYDRTTPLESTTVEVMVWGDPTFEEWFDNRFNGGNPAGYIPVNNIIEILGEAGSRMYKAKEERSGTA
jgi:hypothetical protein